MIGVLVLNSGGMDSAVLIAKAQEDPERELRGLVFFDYGQPAYRLERLSARMLAVRAGFKAPSFDGQNAAGFMLQPKPGHLLEWRVALPSLGKMGARTGDEGPRVVPWRNLVLLALACNYAETIGVQEVWYGACADDAQNYPDCRASFVYGMDAALATLPPGDLSRVDRGPVIRAPLVADSKAQIVREGLRLGVDFTATSSCYTPRNGKPCHTCNSCRARNAVLTAKGQPCPT